MMKYLTELHIHTSGVSPCADFTPEEVVEKYLKYGYHSLVLTNHYSAKIFNRVDDDWNEKAAHFLSDYHTMKDYAGDRLHILLGMELRFAKNDNDYLLYGADEKFFLQHPNLHKMSVKGVHALAQENGLLLIQAHPFRNNIVISNPENVDGYEVFNGHPGHDGRNQIALEWCRLYHGIPTSGSDFHHPNHTGCGGIYTDSPITTEKQLVEVLKSRQYRLRCTGEAAARDGLQDMDSF